jgi:transcription termination/antitermination protein NusA
MKINVWNTILQLSKERGVEPSVIIAAIEESLRVAGSKYYTHGESVQILFRPEKGELRVYTERRIVEKPADTAREVGLEEARMENPSAELGEMLEVDLPSDTLGRIAAQAAKQVIVQKVRDAEQEKIYDEYAPRIGEIVAGVFRRSEPGVDILEVHKTDVLLPLREKLPGDRFERGDRVRSVITQVRRGYKGQEPQVFVSRATPKFLERLLALEIPEISSGTIEIKDIVRQPGERAKVAVLTRERDVDPVGACIGMKGARILAISKELGGEKIDIIVWSVNPAQYARAALSPARVENVLVADKTAKVLQAVVGPDQLSLAIGKKGINVKLASKLVGWKIAIQPQT